MSEMKPGRPKNPALTAPGTRQSAGTYNERGRFVPDAPYNEPFWSRGDGAWRNGRKLPSMGWYLIDNDGDLHGPFKSKVDALRAKSS